MRNASTLATCALGILMAAHGLEGQSLQQYRNFQFGSGLAAVSTLTGVATSEAKTIHQRPAVLLDLNWRPSRYIAGSATASTDPVEEMVFSFYNDQLFRVVVDYDRDRTEGMTDADMIQAISASYGTPLPKTSRAASRAALSTLDIESGTPLARWGDPAGAAVLYRATSYTSRLRLVVTETRLEGLARQATTQAVRLDEQEAPQREIARQKKERDDRRAAEEKARVANQKVFVP